MSHTSRTCTTGSMLTYSLGECANSLVMNGIFGFAMLFYTKSLGLDPDVGRLGDVAFGVLGGRHRTGDGARQRQHAQPLGPPPSVHVGGRIADGGLFVSDLDGSRVCRGSQIGDLLVSGRA